MGINKQLADDILRAHLLKLLRGGNAHMSLDYAVADYPPESINEFPPNVPYSCWHLLEHIRISQRDILNFIKDPNYVWLNFPDDYWPDPSETADETRWRQTIQDIRDDTKELEEIVEDPETDLYS
ncbi:MAG: DinB family protein, partial [Anaerolineales bacterium]|nr:DinB family protein [Anaerolineales bacterium]